MAALALESLLPTAITLLLLAAGYAVGSWRAGSRSTRNPKSKPDAPPTPISDVNYAKVLAEMAELSSTVEKLALSVRRNSSRAYQRDLRDQADEPKVPPPGTSKAELRRLYGVGGMSGPQQAAHQLELERKKG